jgi:hypothetical protein
MRQEEVTGPALTVDSCPPHSAGSARVCISERALGCAKFTPRLRTRIVSLILLWFIPEGTEHFPDPQLWPSVKIPTPVQQDRAGERKSEPWGIHGKGGGILFSSGLDIFKRWKWSMGKIPFWVLMKTLGRKEVSLCSSLQQPGPGRELGV